MKPNEPLKNQSGCKSGKCRPVRKETVRLHKAELEQCGGKKVAKVEIPEETASKLRTLKRYGFQLTPEAEYRVSMRGEVEAVVGKELADRFIPSEEYHCKRCDKDVIDGRCECLSSPSPWELKTKMKSIPGFPNYQTPDVEYKGITFTGDPSPKRVIQVGDAYRELTPEELAAESEGWQINPQYTTAEYKEYRLRWKKRKPSNIWKWIAFILLLSLATMTFLLSEKINLLNEVIDFQQELFRELEKSELPQGDGGIENPGVLPPKGWINPNTIINADIITYTF